MARLVVGSDEEIGFPISVGKIRGQMIFDYSDVRTTEYSVEEQPDDSTYHHSHVKVTLEVVGVVNARFVASNKAGEPLTGDVLSFSLANLRDWMLVPRQYFRFEVGGKIVLESPILIGGGPGIGTRALSDARGGPFAQRATFTPIIGSKSAVLHYKVVTYQSYGQVLLLSNVWSQTAETGTDGMTTRTTRGRAVFRKDFLDRFDGVADDYRKWLIVPCPDGSRRVDFSVTQDESGSIVDYGVVDREITFGLGAGNPVVEVTGSCSAGVDFPIKDLKTAIALGPPLVGALAVGGTLGAIGGPAGMVVGAAIASSMTLWGSVVPTCRFVATARAIGRKDCNRLALQTAAIGFCMDRLKYAYNPRDGIGMCVSSWVTFNVDTDHSPHCDVKIEVMGISANIVKDIFRVARNPEALGMHLNRANFVVVDGKTYGPNDSGPAMPNQGNTRGTWTTRLVAQALAEPVDVYQLPEDPPTPETFRNTFLPDAPP